MPRLRILAGPSMAELKPIQANSGSATDISSEAFEGKVAVYIKNFAGTNGEISKSPYFEQEARKDVTWSVQVQGRFLQAHSANDVLFGNVFDRPLNIPWGFSTILNFMRYLDPTLEQDLSSKTRPWALSPLVSTTPHFCHTRTDELHKVPPFPPLTPLEDDTGELKLEDGQKPAELSEKSAMARRAFFKEVESRNKIMFGPEDLITTDFCYNYLSFNPTGVALQLPGGFSLDMMKYWDGQPVYFVCCERKTAKDRDQPIGRIFWCVAIQILDGEADECGETDSTKPDQGENSNATADDVD